MQKQTKAEILIIFTMSGFYADGDVAGMSETDRLRYENYEKSTIRTLYSLGIAQMPEHMGQAENFLYLLSTTFFQKLTGLPELEIAREQAEVVLEADDCEQLLQALPFSPGAENVDLNWLEMMIDGLNTTFKQEITQYKGTVALYLTEQNQHLHVPERVFFHLVENRDGVEPFAFMATYATKTSEGRIKHVPLKYALTEYGSDREKLLALLSCLNRAAEISPLIAGFMESGELFHALYLSAEQAYEFLKEIEMIEKAGILCRIPNWWKRKASTVSTSVTLGDKRPSMLGFDTLISMQPHLMVEGVTLTEEDIRILLTQTEGLMLLKGKWVEVDHARLRELLQAIEEMPDHLTLLEAMRLNIATDKPTADVGMLISNGKWLSELLRNLQRPETIRALAVPPTLHATLRPYQKNGYTWLDYMNQLGFGACLADDMGLGKTIQVLTYLEKMRKLNPTARVLLIVPASLLGNWQKEAEKFVPSMELCILHGKPKYVLEEELEDSETFLNITTYGMASRIKAFSELAWDCIILDEAQAIKNPTTNQTRAIKKLSGKMRIAMTGTPIENDLTNLWSLFDFLNKGLLGSSREFHDFCKGLESHPERYAKLKMMIAPFMLRRLKTDKKVIADLPDKVEMTDYVAMTKKQVVLYRQVVAQMEDKLSLLTGIERRGVVLATIMKLKQVCNHPDQLLGQNAYNAVESGKFAVLRELCETIFERRERVLVFTQFREITDYLSAFLELIAGRKGYVLHGGTPVKRRSEIVEAFQGEKYVPYIVLSVKAGGTGLNLTKANHVIHFDRWWNPAVENQATDRAFRIGQTKDVLVHKLVCEGTIEEKIDAMIASKKELAENVIGTGAERWITEMNDQELLSLMRLE